jgi:trigger factor
LRRIAGEEKIDVTEDELNGEISSMATYYSASPEQLRENLEKNDRMDDFREDIRIRKTLDLLMEKAQVEL